MTDAVEKGLSELLERNNRIQTAIRLNRNCVRGSDFESNVARSYPQNRFSTASTQSGHWLCSAVVETMSIRMGRFLSGTMFPMQKL
jgi:hypothetical protein